MEKPFAPVPEFEDVPDVEPVDEELVVVVRELLVVEEFEDVWPEFVKLDSEDPEFRVCALPDAETRIVNVSTKVALIANRIIEESSFPRNNIAYHQSERSDGQAISFIVPSVPPDQSLTIESSGRI